MRPELGFVVGLQPPADLPKGECWAVNIYEDGEITGIRIERADPRVLISEELLGMMFTNPSPHVHLRLADIIPFDYWYLGATLRIDGTNRTVIYHITEYAPSVRGYVGEWPD